MVRPTHLDEKVAKRVGTSAASAPLTFAMDGRSALKGPFPIARKALIPASLFDIVKDRGPFAQRCLDLIPCRIARRGR